MTIREEIKSILILDSVPVAHIHYTGSSSTFVTWTVIQDDPVFNADDECNYSEVTIDVDVYSKDNYEEIVDEIKKIMLENNWRWYEDGPEMYEVDTKLYHLTCSFKKERSLLNG